MKIERMKYHTGDKDKDERVVADIVHASGASERLVVETDAAVCGGRVRGSDGLIVLLPPDVRLEILQFVKTEREKVLEQYPVKTKEGWSESGVGGLDDYCKPGDEVDEEMADHFLNCLPPAYWTSQIIQCGEPVDSVFDENGKMRNTYTTFEKMPDGKWYYRGDCIKGETVKKSSKLRGMDWAIASLEKQIEGENKA
jgi:hypothetical protein